MEKLKEILKKLPIVHFTIKHLIMFFYFGWSKIIEFFYEFDLWLISHHFKEEALMYQKVKEFKGKYAGKRCFIVATGPSLRIEDLDTLYENKEYVFSMNTIVNAFDKTEFRPTFYCIQDKEVYSNIREKIDIVEMKNIFIGIANIPLKRVKICDEQLLKGDNVIPYRLNVIYHWMQVIYNTVKPELKFSFDCSKQVYDGSTIAYSVIQLAQYMGFKEIYLLGADCDYSGNVDHFDGTKSSTNANNGDFFMRSYFYAKKYLNETDVHIYNATRGGKLEVFPRVNFDDLFLA